MSYYIIKYEFMGQDSAGLRGGEVQFRSASSSSLWRCLDGFFHECSADCDFRRNISKPTISR